MTDISSITEGEFSQFQRFIYEEAGITLAASKKLLVSSRLAKRLQQCRMGSYGEYFKYLKSGTAPVEVQNAIDLLTTNETYFFREPKHFDLLKEQAMVAHKRSQPYRVWSAASSSGEEAYSMAMVLADCMDGTPWDVLGTDISARVLQRAANGHYSMERAKHIPKMFLQKYCLKGLDDQQGTLLVDRNLRNKVHFRLVNLNAPLPELGRFDMIFLRNVMIYFNDETKRQVIERVLALLKPGGYFCVGHSETLNGLSNAVQSVAPSIYRKP
jgi:chemotaxis protein methyltransferase CheR